MSSISVGAPQPWPPPPTSSDNKSFRNCLSGICSASCPQFCLFLQPPPASFFDPDNVVEDDASSSRNISPLMAALIAVLAAAFLLLLYYTVIARLCRRRHHRRRRLRLLSPAADGDLAHRADPLAHDPARPETGLDEAYIRQITVFRYRKDDGLVEGTECAVCLSEFKEEESLRLMPNCEHAFHIPCIDTWLKTNSSCPLCRSSMNPDPVRVEIGGGGGVSVAAMMAQRSQDPVLVVREVELRGEVEVRVEVATGEERGGSLVNSDERERKEEGGW